MSRKNWLIGVGIAGIVLSVSSPPAMADDGAKVALVARPLPTPMVIPMQQPDCYQKRCGGGVYSWNGPWGPGCYVALPRLHFHRTRSIRPE